MSLRPSEDTHVQLVSRIPQATGRGMAEWFQALEAGPSLLRQEERVDWLRTEHDLSHAYAQAIVHEHVKQKAARSFE